MISRSCVLLSKASSSSSRRTVVRDPRKAAKKVTARERAIVAHQSSRTEQNSNLPVENQQRLPFQPSLHNEQSVGSTLVSYGLAGVGVAMGVTLVSALFGGV